jgi:hypothetical protein
MGVYFLCIRLLSLRLQRVEQQLIDTEYGCRQSLSKCSRMQSGLLNLGGIDVNGVLAVSLARAMKL